MQPEFVLALFPITAACIFIFALYMRFRRRELQHKERLAAIEKGVGLPELNDFEPGPRIYLLRGMIWLFSGLTLLVFLVGVSLTTTDQSGPVYRAKRWHPGAGPAGRE